jgi:putative ABC transport system permease protein
MKLLHDLIGAWHRLTGFARRRRIAREVDEEVAFHLAMRERDQQAGGLAPDDARRAARRRFGNPTAISESTRDMWTFPSFDSLVQDVRFALRTLRKSPGFTFVAVFALAVGIGANTAIFSLVDAMLVRGLPYSDADRLVVLIGNVQRVELERRGASFPDYLDWREQSTRFEAMAAYRGTATTVSEPGDPERIQIEAVSAPYFDVLGVSPAIGRIFRLDEDTDSGGPRVVVLSHGLWQRRFGGDPSVVGRTLRLGPATWEIVGVMPPGFAGLTDAAELWIPFTLSGFPLDSRGTRAFSAIARLRSDASVEAARTELDTISRRLEAAYPETNEKRGVEISPLSVETFGQVQPAVMALMAAVGFVLLIACANVANLQISRSETRQREIAVRTALGAGRMRLLRQLITESLVLAGLGAIAGLGVAHVAVQSLVAASPVSLPSFAAPGLNGWVLLFTAGVAIACGLILGVAPALHSRISRLADVLKASARGSSGSTSRLRAGLVVAEVTLAVVLVAGAGLMIRTVQNLTAIDPGFDTESMLVLNVSVPRAQAAADASADAPPPPFVVSSRELIDRLEALPGVRSASLASDLPLQGGGSAIFYAADGDTTTNAEARPRAYVHRVTSGFFDTMGIPFTHGRTFELAELTPDSTAVIVTEALVRRFWPGQDPVGRRVKPGSAESPGPWLTIVGVVPDLKYRALPDNPTTDPDLFFPYVDRGVQAVMLRTDVDPASLIDSVRGTLRELDRTIVVFQDQPMRDIVAGWSQQSRFTTWLMGVFAATALLLAVVGIYGVMSYLVSQRTREFGIRLALGAGSGQILRVVMRQGAMLVAAGLVIGTAAAFGLARWIEALLFQVSTTDASAFAAIALMGVVALLACAVPAWRATRVDPVDALRAE